MYDKAVRHSILMQSGMRQSGRSVGEMKVKLKSSPRIVNRQEVIHALNQLKAKVEAVEQSVEVKSAQIAMKWSDDDCYD